MKPSRKEFAAAAGAVAAFGIVPSRSRAAQFTLKLGHDVPASHPVGVGAAEMAAAIARESNGRMEVKVFPNNALGGDSQMVAQLRLGAIEMLIVGAGVLSAVSPVMDSGVIGFAFKTEQSALAAMEGDLGDLYRRELEAKGIRGMERLWSAGFRELTTSNRPIRNVDDMDGLKLRVAVTAITVDLFKSLGASPTAMDLNQLYSALSTHVIDAADGPYINLFAQRIWEVQRYLSVTHHQWSGYWFVVSGEAWKMLPPDLQAILSRNANRYAMREQRMAGLQSGADGDVLVRYGMKRNIADTTGFRQRLTGYYQRWKKEYGPGVWTAIERYSGTLG